MSDIRWADEAARAARHAGWSVVETRGVSDWQGWGVHLLVRRDESDEVVAADAAAEGRDDVAIRLRSRAEWSVMAWDYGSCGGCDAYEDRVSYDDSPEQLLEVFGELIETCADEDAARLKFSERQGW